MNGVCMATSANNPQPLAATAAEPSLFGIPRSWQLGDNLFQLLCQVAALSVVVVSLALAAVLVGQAWLTIHSLGARFFFSSNWNVARGEFGSLTFVYGTLATSLIAMLIAVPLGVGTAAFLSEIATGWVRQAGSFLVEMLAAIPSVVYGFWAYFVLMPAVQWFFVAIGGPNRGDGILSASLILAIMIVPYVAAVSFDVCRAVPTAQREAAYALGATRWQTIWSVVLPYARPGIIGGCFLALGRALGETMAVTMLIGNNNQIDWSLFATGSTIPSLLANQFLSAATDLHRSAMVELALVLLLVSIACNAAARLLLWRMAGGARPGAFSRWFAFGNTPAPPIPLSPPLANGADSENPKANRDAGVSPNADASFATAPANRHNAAINHLMTGVLALCLAITGGLLLFILLFLVYHGVGALNWDFFVNNPAPVGEPGGGMANALFGSFMLVGLASAFAIPVGILAAVYLAEYRSDRLGPVVRFIGELLAGVPSIVIGIFTYFLLVRPMGSNSAWSGAFALGVMMIPIVMRTTEEALRLVPASLRHASYALGASQWQTVLKVTLPAALPAVVTAIFLAIARVVGETAPLIFTAASNSGWPRSPNGPTPSLPIFIYNYAQSASDDWRRQGWAAALVLLTVVMLLSFGVRLVTGRRAIATRQAG
jgi:phosphate transport system permease protein